MALTLYASLFALLVSITILLITNAPLAIGLVKLVKATLVKIAFLAGWLRTLGHKLPPSDFTITNFIVLKIVNKDTLIIRKPLFVINATLLVKLAMALTIRTVLNAFLKPFWIKVENVCKIVHLTILPTIATKYVKNVLIIAQDVKERNQLNAWIAFKINIYMKIGVFRHVHLDTFNWNDYALLAIDFAEIVMVQLTIIALTALMKCFTILFNEPATLSAQKDRIWIKLLENVSLAIRHVSDVLIQSLKAVPNALKHLKDKLSFIC